MGPIRSSGLAGLALLAACGQAPRVGTLRPDAGVTAATFGGLVETVFVPRCATASCHSGNPPPSAPTSLDADLAYAQLVGVSASQDPSLALVEPGDPSRSYLVLKLRRQGSPATDMPPGDPLAEPDIQAIEAWIASGAPND